MAEKYMLIGCEILFREICLCAARSKNIIDLEFLEKGLHDKGEKKMSEALQKAIDRVDTTKYSAILLGYCLCNNGIRGLRARIPMVVPVAHDCVTLFMGSKEKYMDYFQNNPGTFFMASGWLERTPSDDFSEDGIMSQLGLRSNRDYESYAEEFGDDNAEFLMEMLGNYLKNYRKIAYIDTGVGDSAAFEAMSIADAQEKNLQYEKLKGDISLIQKLMDGDWNENDFLEIPPGNEIICTFDGSIISCKPVQCMQCETGAR